MTLRARQRLLAKFLTSPGFEALLREAPDTVAASVGATVEFGRWLAQLDPKRVAAFRASREVKAARRQG